LGNVGGEPITAAQVRAAAEQMLRGSNVTQQQMATMYPLAFRNLIQERALLFEANRLGFGVSDEDLVAAIQAIPQFNRDGKFIGAEQYRLLLQQNGYTPAQFEASLRKEIISGRLSSMIARTVVVSNEEVDAALKERHEKISLQYLSIDPLPLMSQITPSEEEIDAFYAIAENKVRIPESRDFDVVRISMERAMEKTTVSMAEVKAFYDANMDRWRFDEQRHLRHILISTEGKNQAERAILKAKAEDLLKQAQGGADFAKLAKENSDDKSNAADGGDLGWIFRGQTEPGFEQVAFNLKVGEIGGVAETSYGYHIIKSEGSEPAKVRTVEEVRDEIAGELTSQRATELVQQTAERLRAEVASNPDNVEAIVNAEPLAQFARYQSISNTSSVGNISSGTQLRQEMNERNVGEVTYAGEIGGNSMAFAIVRKINPDREATKEEALARITATLKEHQASNLAQRKLEEAAEALRSGADIRTVARNMGLTYGEAPPFNRLSAAEGIGNVGELYQAFNQPVGGMVPPFRSGNKFYLVKVSGKEEANLAELAKERDEIRRQLTAVKAQERLQLYLEGVQSRLEKEGRIKLDTERVTALMLGGRNI
jgi:peptidyl-prolyl cis-trans isomerase D